MKRRYKLHPGQYELGENEKFYGDMEARGWRLKKRGAYFSRFEPAEPGETRYRIEVFHPGAWSANAMPEEQLAVFQAAVADVIEEFKGVYGADACAAFGIN